MVQDHLIEFTVGETIQIGQYAVTLVEVDGTELCLQIEGYDEGDVEQVNSGEPGLESV